MGKTSGKIATIIVMIILMVISIAVKPSIAAEVASDDRFIAYDDGTVLDTQTNLLWAARDNGKNINWEDARLYCENYNGGDYKGSRMPTKDELKGLYNRLIFGNNGHHLTKLITLTGSFPWASDIQGSEAAYVIFDYDYAAWCRDSLSRKWRSRVLPVRNGREIKNVIIEEKKVVVVPPPPPPPPPLPVAPPPSATTTSSPPPPLVRERVSIALNVEFDFAKSVVKEKYYNDIKRVADFMRIYPDTDIVIEGHTDNVDSFNNPDNNIKLSQARAHSVRKYLVDNFGIDASRITAIGYGPNRPIASNDTEEGRQKNRRIEAVIETMVTK